MYRERRKHPTLMPAVALATLGALIAIPTLSSMRLYAAAPEHFQTVVVQRGDSLWSLAADHAGQAGGIEEAVDAIISANHLASAVIQPGQRLKIPQ
jgi:LysM repeat protein